MQSEGKKRNRNRIADIMSAFPTHRRIAIGVSMSLVKEHCYNITELGFNFNSFKIKIKTQLLRSLFFGRKLMWLLSDNPT